MRKWRGRGGAGTGGGPPTGLCLSRRARSEQQSRGHRERMRKEGQAGRLRTHLKTSGKRCRVKMCSLAGGVLFFPDAPARPKMAGGGHLG